MNSQLRATPEMKADVADRAPLLLTHADGTITLERPTKGGALEDIAANRLRELANRLAGTEEFPTAADGEASLDHADAEIAPVSLVTITQLRTLAMPDADDDWLPVTPMTAIAPSAPFVRTDTPTALEPPAPTVVPTIVSEAKSERDLQSLLAVLEPSAPLRISGEPPSSLLVPASPPNGFADDAAKAVAPTEGDQPSKPTDGALMLSDPSASDIRLVDLIKRQQSLLDQLNRFPPAATSAPEVPEAPFAAPADLPAAPAWSVVDQLAPPLPAVATDQRRLPSDETPPPLPSTGVLRLPDKSLEDAEPALPERSPMIIQRARAERSGLYDPNSAAAPPSPLPAFAAGLAMALAIAGTLLFVL